MTIIKCPDCGSTSIYKRGFRHNKQGKVQKYSCNNCGAVFGDSANVRGMKHTKEDIDKVLTLMNRDDICDLVEVKKDAEKEGIKLSLKTMERWLYKYDSDFNKGKGLWEGEGVLTWKFDKQSGEWVQYRKKTTGNID